MRWRPASAAAGPFGDGDHHDDSGTGCAAGPDDGGTLASLVVMPMFCRHNRMIGKCPICRKEQEDLLPKPPARQRRSPSTRPSAPAASAPARGASPRRGSTRLVTRRLQRAADDGYRNPLAPGLRATADAERLAIALTLADARLVPPGPYPAVAAEPDRDEALWLAFLLALIGPDAPERQAQVQVSRPSWSSGETPELPAAEQATAEAYRAWAARAGSQAAAFAGEPAWTPTRRFARLFERLALPGFGRGRRFELLVTLGAAGLYELEADALHFGTDDDRTTQGAKRLLVSGDRMLLERRARDLAAACELPMAALDRGLALWAAPATPLELQDRELPAPIRRALLLS